jgi:ADP-ribosylglycohydrolase
MATTTEPSGRSTLSGPAPDSTPVVRSALWAAWGDALGFPTELTRSGQSLQGRLGADEVTVPIAWKRRIGGRFGVETDLPAGAYSDDTQLRLSVSRSIRGRGRFDVEAFSKIELPVSISYGLGVGRGTKQAATALSHRSIRWFSNFFDNAGQIYTNGGGNGAAMRIQPHVWVAADHRAERYLPGLLRDAVSTHGHPRGILGAAWHALVLGATIRDGAIPSPSSWGELTKSLGRIATRMDADESMRTRWLPTWEQTTGKSFSQECDRVTDECLDLVAAASRIRRGGTLYERYAELAGSIGGLNPQTRGSGTISAMLALWVAWAADGDALAALRSVANLRGSDTDTVATLAGALLGAVVDRDPPGDLQDRELIVSEARRLDAIRDGLATTDFAHPDPLGWTPPRTQSDSLGMGDDGELMVLGLGRCEAISEELVGSGKSPGRWQWVRTDFGQTLFIKRRGRLPAVPDGALPRVRKPFKPMPVPPPKVDDLRSTELRREAGQPPSPAEFENQNVEDSDLPGDVEDALRVAAEAAFDERLVGRLLMHLARQQHGAEKAGVFAGLLSRRLPDS